MSQLDEFNQNNLLFKRFQGVIQTNIINPNSFNNEFGKPSLVNRYNDTIFSSNVSRDLSSNTTVLNLTLQLPGAPSVIDTSANSWQTGVYGEYTDLKTADNIAITNLKFYQKVFLKSISSGPYAWWLIDPSLALPFTTNNLLKDMIPFSYGTTGATYSPVVWYYTGAIPTTATQAENLANDPNNWTPDFNQNSTPLYWLVDYASGVLQFYAQADSNGHITTTSTGNKIKPTTPNNYIGNKPDPTSVPRISFIKYTGDKGAAPIGGGGGSDISGVDISNIEINLEKLNRMILPDGFVDISGSDYDLCGNEVVRTYYTYNRKNMFIGYENLPILDGSAVNHLQDPSHNNITYELDVSGSLYVSNHSQLNDVSCSNLDISNNLIVLGHSLLNDVSCSNLDVSNNLIVLGHSLLNDVSCSNLDVSNNLIVLGHSLLNDVSCSNLDVSNNLIVLRHSLLNDVSCSNLDVSNNIILWGDMSMNGGQITFIGDATDPSGVPSWGQVQQAIIDGSGGQSYWLQSGTSIYYNTGNVGIGTTTPSQRLEVSGNVVFDGILDMCCNNIIDVSNIYFCNTSAILGQTLGVLTISGDLDMSMNQITTIADATDNSGVPSWGQVQALVSGGSGSYWTQSGTDLYYNSGNVGIGTATPSTKLDINGSINVTENADIQGYAQVSGNLLVATDSTDLTSTGITDYNAYFRRTNIDFGSLWWIEQFQALTRGDKETPARLVQI